ncbi:MAG: 1-acyl-sn-glycerol-3-phosphate acyltransferase [Rhodoferax sp.]|nr:1-acyl-sn-glycerol-3-phosphate acyltransferase [Rhodoferax sp.]
MKHFRALWRAWRVVVHVLWGALQIVLDFPRRSQEQRDLRVQLWAARALVCLGVELRIAGTPPVAGPLLLVANHISWLDIVVLHAAHHCRFVSKDDVQHWPLVGILATGAGTLYVKRTSRRDAMRVVHNMVQALQNGDILAIFPEGTTSNGHALLPFHANLLQAAISAPADVQPVALAYHDGQSAGASQAMSYVGDESLLGSVWRTMGAKGLCATVVFGNAQTALGRDRRTWAHELRNTINELRQC